MPRPSGGQGDSLDKKPTSNFVHLSYKALVDHESLRKGEDLYYTQVLRAMSMMLGAFTLGSYVSAKSFFFQDWFGAAVICVFLTLIIANSSTINHVTRTAECAGVYFFSGCCLSTILWWNFNFNHWNIVKVMCGMSVAAASYQIPVMLRLLIQGFSFKSSTKSPQESKAKDVYTRNKHETDRWWFFVFGPLSVFAGLYLMDLIVGYFTNPILIPAWRTKVTLTFGVWAMFFGQFLVMKARTYDRDIVWQMILIMPETFFALFMVPKSIVSPDEEDL